jgi:biotin-(acetyl-CoA carboxylase) ligase
MAAVLEALAPCEVLLGLKWPNDLVAFRQTNNGKKHLVKIGGIIGEQKENSVTLGLGLNLLSAPVIPERAIPPASLSSLGAIYMPDTVSLAKNILTKWQNLEIQRPVAFRWPTQGDTICWEDGNGTCQGWEADGRLAVSTESGIVLLASGDVFRPKKAFC